MVKAHDRDVLPAIDTLGRGVSVEIVAHYAWKWDAIAQRVSAHYESRGWRVLRVEGDATVKAVPFFSIGLAGVGGSETRSPTLVSALQDLSTRFAKSPGLIVLVDAGQLDPQSRSVLLHASRRWSVPLLVLRTLESQDGAGGAGLAGAYSYELLPPTLAEFRAALESRLQCKVDHLAATRVFTMTAGQLDLAVSIVEAGLWGGTFERRGDVLALGTWRWESSYHRPVEAALEHLDLPSRAALAALADAGPTPVELARRVVPDEVLGSLQASRHLAIVEDGSDACVMVMPPVVSEYLRRTAWPLTPIPPSDEELLAPMRLSVVAPSAQVRAAQLISLAEEKSHRELFLAEQSWRRHRDLSTATRLLRAVIVTGTVVDDRTMRALDDMTCAPDSRDAEPSRAAVELQALRWTLHARDHGDCAEATRQLRSLAADAATDEHRAYLLVRACRLEQAYHLTTDTADLAAVGSRGELSSWINDSLWLTIAGTHLCQGDAAAAVDTLAKVREAWDFDDEFLALSCLIAVALFRADEVLVRRRLAQLHALAESRGTLVALEVSAAYHAAASLAGFTGPEFEVPRELGIQLGLPLDRGPAGVLGASFTAASFNSLDPWLGFLVTTYDMQSGRDALSERCRMLVDGWALAHDQLVAGDLSGTAECMVALGDRLRELGAEQPAIQAYLVALETASPGTEVLARVQSGLRQFELELVALYRDHPLPESSEDGHFWRGMAEGLEKAGLTGAAARTWKRAITAHRRTGDDDARRGAEERLDELFKVRWTWEGALHTPSEIPLTDREREIAELIATGMSNRDIAHALNLSVRTVEAHTHRILRKAGLSRRQEVATYLLHHPGSARLRRIG